MCQDDIERNNLDPMRQYYQRGVHNIRRDDDSIRRGDMSWDENKWQYYQQIRTVYVGRKEWKQGLQK
jgi:hypothetical protein